MRSSVGCRKFVVFGSALLALVWSLSPGLVAADDGDDHDAGDTTAPVVTAPPSITLEATGPSMQVDLGSASAFDDVDGALTAIPNKIGPFGVGQHTVRWRATDSAGNTGTANQIVRIVDTRAPTLTVSDLTVEATGRFTAVSLSAEASDIADPTLNPRPSPRGPFALGTHTINWSVTDSSGNTTTATQTLTVRDTTPPEITVESFSIEATDLLTPVELEATAVDLVDGERAARRFDNQVSFPPGDHTIFWTARDESGNAAFAVQVVRVTRDHILPEVTAPADITLEATAPLTPVELGVASGSDFFEGELAPLASNPGPFAVGEHVITWRVVNSVGGEATATQTIVITDTTAPVFALQDKTILATGPLTPPPETFADDLGDGQVLAVADPSEGLPLGEHVINWQATDSSGNSTRATQRLTITREGLKPIVTPPDTVVVEATGPLTAVNLGQAAARDVIDGELAVFVDNEGPFTVGQHTVSWRATNTVNETTVELQQIIVEDTTAPNFLQPDDQVLEASGYLTAVRLEPLTIPDQVDQELQVVPDKQGPFRSGNHIVNWIARDKSGNQTVLEQMLTIHPQLAVVARSPQRLGQSFKFQLLLTGDAAIYPVNIDYEIRGVDGMVLYRGEAQIDEGRQLDIDVTLSLVLPQLAEVVILGGINAELGEQSRQVVELVTSDSPIAPRVELELLRGEPLSHLIYGDDPAELTVSIDEPQPRDYRYQWSSPSPTLNNLLELQVGDTVAIQPEQLAAGSYQVVVEAQAPDGEVFRSQLDFVVMDSEVPLQEDADSDNDGLSDAIEGITDKDRDMIPDLLDLFDVAYVLPGNLDNPDTLLTTRPGITLRRGSFASRYNPLGFVIDSALLTDAEGRFYFDSDYEQPEGAFDFEALDLPSLGAQSRFVVQLQQPLAGDAEYHVLALGIGWRRFAADSQTNLLSAPFDLDGGCPDSQSDAYRSGLNAGDRCLLLLLTDGGKYDSDAQANYRLAHTGRIVQKRREPSIMDLPDTVGGSGAVHWRVFSLLLLLIVFKRLVFSKQTQAATDKSAVQ